LLETIVVGDVLHDILNAALENVAQFINCVCFNILIVAKPIDLRAIYIVMGIQVVLTDAAFLHSVP
jgi:hypothetical protein